MFILIMYYQIDSNCFLDSIYIEIKNACVSLHGMIIDGFGQEVTRKKYPWEERIHENYIFYVAVVIK